MTDSREPRGTSPFIASGIEITIEGQKRMLRRLRISDLFRLADIARNIIANGTMQYATWLSTIRVDPQQMYGAIIALGLAGGEQGVLSLLASILGVDEADIDDASKFPISCVPELAEAMLEHPDIKTFFSNFEKVKPRLLELLPKSAPADGSNGHAETSSPAAST